MNMYPPIKNEHEYDAALEAIEQILDAEPGTPEGEKFQALAKMIEEYDDLHHRLNGE
jgi:antitoxin component HigA of HigAB toxin-antitoxin module